jgi:deoxyadenosine/deoxycytidine kinase
LNALYEDLMASWNLSPVEVVEADRLDFVEREEDRMALLEALKQRLGP